MNVYRIKDWIDEDGNVYQFRGKNTQTVAERAFRQISDRMGFTDSEDGTKFLTFELQRIKNTGNNTAIGAGKKEKNITRWMGTWIQLASPIQTKAGTVHRRPVITEWTPDMDHVFRTKEELDALEANRNK